MSYYDTNPKLVNAFHEYTRMYYDDDVVTKTDMAEFLAKNASGVTSENSDTNIFSAVQSDDSYREVTQEAKSVSINEIDDAVIERIKKYMGTTAVEIPINPASTSKKPKQSLKAPDINLPAFPKFNLSLPVIPSLASILGGLGNMISMFDMGIDNEKKKKKANKKKKNDERRKKRNEQKKKKEQRRNNKRENKRIRKDANAQRKATKKAANAQRKAANAQRKAASKAANAQRKAASKAAKQKAAAMRKETRLAQKATDKAARQKAAATRKQNRLARKAAEKQARQKLQDAKKQARVERNKNNAKKNQQKIEDLENANKKLRSQLNAAQEKLKKPGPGQGKPTPKPSKNPQTPKIANQSPAPKPPQPKPPAPKPPQPKPPQPKPKPPAPKPPQPKNWDKLLNAADPPPPIGQPTVEGGRPPSMNPGRGAGDPSPSRWQGLKNNIQGARDSKLNNIIGDTASKVADKTGQAVKRTAIRVGGKTGGKIAQGSGRALSKTFGAGMKAMPAIGLAFAAYEVAAITDAYSKATTPGAKQAVAQEWLDHMKGYSDGKVSIGYTDENGEFHGIEDMDLGLVTDAMEFLGKGFMEGPALLAHTANWHRVLDDINTQETMAEARNSDLSTSIISQVNDMAAPAQGGEFMLNFLNNYVKNDDLSEEESKLNMERSVTMATGMAQILSPETMTLLDDVFSASQGLGGIKDSMASAAYDQVKLFERGYGKLNKVFSVEDDDEDDKPSWAKYTEKDAYAKAIAFEEALNRSVGSGGHWGDIGLGFWESVDRGAEWDKQAMRENLSSFMGADGSFLPDRLMDLIIESEDETLPDLWNPSSTEYRNPGLEHIFAILQDDFNLEGSLKKPTPPTPPISYGGMYNTNYSVNTSANEKYREEYKKYQQDLAHWKKATNNGKNSSEKTAIRNRYKEADKMYKAAPGLHERVTQGLPKLRDSLANDILNHYKNLEASGFKPEVNEEMMQSKEYKMWLDKKIELDKDRERIESGSLAFSILDLSKSDEEKLQAKQQRLETWRRKRMALEASNPTLRQTGTLTAKGDLLSQANLQGAKYNLNSGGIVASGSAQATATGQSGGQLTYAFDLQQGGPSGVSPRLIQEINQDISDLLHHAEDINDIMDLIAEVNDRLPEDIQINTSSITYTQIKTPEIDGITGGSNLPGAPIQIDWGGTPSDKYAK